jgi:hypothetical protein
MSGQRIETTINGIGVASTKRSRKHEGHKSRTERYAASLISERNLKKQLRAIRKMPGEASTITRLQLERLCQAEPYRLHIYSEVQLKTWGLVEELSEFIGERLFEKQTCPIVLIDIR